MKGLLQAKEIDFCVMHGLFPLSVLVYFSFLSERKDRVEGGSLCSFTAELEEEVHLKEAHFIAECSEYQEDHGETSSPPACTDHVADHAVFTWLITHLSRD